MKIDEIKIDVANGFAAEFRAVDGADLCQFVLRDIGELGWPYNQKLAFWMPARLSGKMQRIAAAINEIMASDDETAPAKIATE